MPKAPFARRLNSEQLFSGHLRIDLVQPMTKGNVILMEGNRRTGKSTVAEGIIRQYLAENPEHKAVYVSMSPEGDNIAKNIKSDRLMCIGAENESAAQMYLAPHLALKVAAECRDCLLVFDDVLLHQNREKAIFDLADQPFSPVNILNEV